MHRIKASALACIAAFAAWPASAADEIRAELDACRAEADDGRRLACYDRVATPAPSASTSTEDSFGRERRMAHEEDQRRKQETRAIGKLEATVVAIERRGVDGLMTFTLDNDQVWRQNTPDSRFSLKEGDAIRIQPGSLNSFILSGPGKKSTRVTRVK
jgi:hypothetical protein